MWASSGNNIKTTEDDYGVALTITFDGIEFSEDDYVKFTFKDKMNGETVLEKEFTSISDNAISLEFDEDDIALFSVGMYVYSIDWYQDGVFLCNILPKALFEVVDKA